MHEIEEEQSAGGEVLQGLVGRSMVLDRASLVMIWEAFVPQSQILLHHKRGGRRTQTSALKLDLRYNKHDQVLGIIFRHLIPVDGSFPVC